MVYTLDMLDPEYRTGAQGVAMSAMHTEYIVSNSTARASQAREGGQLITRPRSRMLWSLTLAPSRLLSARWDRNRDAITVSR